MLIRPLIEQDRPLIEGWIAAEPDHKNNTFEWYQAPGSKTVIYEDSEGPVFTVRYSSALRTDMEFNPEASKERVRAMFKEVVPEAAKQAKAQGFSEIVFQSVSKRLIVFLRAFGFKTCPDYRKIL